MSDENMVAREGAVYRGGKAMKRPNLESRSTRTQIAVFPCEMGRVVMKSIFMSSQTCVGIGPLPKWYNYPKVYSDTTRIWMSPPYRFHMWRELFAEKGHGMLDLIQNRPKGYARRVGGEFKRSREVGQN